MTAPTTIDHTGFQLDDLLERGRAEVSGEPELEESDGTC